VIAFYTEIADVILPHLRNRPLTLKRYPEGRSRAATADVATALGRRSDT
jgi:DNA primase